MITNLINLVFGSPLKKIIAIGFTLALVYGGVTYWKHSIKVAERERIAQEQQDDANKKTMRALKDAQEKRDFLDSLSNDELIDYFHHGMQSKDSE